MAAAPRNVIIQGDALRVLRTLPSECVQTCITSPPYWQLRDYGVAGQLGLEDTPDEYVARMVAYFDEVRRVLRPDGTLWLNMGDAYANDGKWGGSTGGKHVRELHGKTGIGRARRHTGLRSKNLMGQPWMLAFALRADGWYLRADIIWHKSNAMPESVNDRPTKAHEYLFLLTKSAQYLYDAEAIKEPVTGGSHPRVAGRNSRKYVDRDARHVMKMPDGWDTGPGAHGRFHRQGREKGRRAPGVTPKSASAGSGIRGNESWHASTTELVVTRNRRSVWTLATQPYHDAHFATMPEALVEPCVLAGSRPGDLVLDPFMGSGTVAVVAKRFARDYLGIELNESYVEMARRRIANNGRVGKSQPAPSGTPTLWDGLDAPD